MRAITPLHLRAALASIVVGVLVGAFGATRSGSILVAAGPRSVRDAIGDLVVPITTIAGTLFTLAVALPKGL